MLDKSKDANQRSKNNNYSKTLIILTVTNNKESFAHNKFHLFIQPI